MGKYVLYHLPIDKHRLLQSRQAFRDAFANALVRPNETSLSIEIFRSCPNPCLESKVASLIRVKWFPYADSLLWLAFTGKYICMMQLCKWHRVKETGIGNVEGFFTRKQIWDEEDATVWRSGVESWVCLPYDLLAEGPEMGLIICYIGLKRWALM